MAETTEFKGYVIRTEAAADGVASHLSWHRVWFSDHFAGAWVHARVPTKQECTGWETKPTDFCAAAWSDVSGNRRVGPWIPWPPEAGE